MSEKDIKRIQDLAISKLKEKPTKEQALKIFVAAGILDEKGNFTEHYPELAKLNKQ